MIFQVAPILPEEQIRMTGNYLRKFQQTPKTYSFNKWDDPPIIGFLRGGKGGDFPSSSLIFYKNSQSSPQKSLGFPTWGWSSKHPGHPGISAILDTWGFVAVPRHRSLQSHLGCANGQCEVAGSKRSQFWRAGVNVIWKVCFCLVSLILGGTPWKINMEPTNHPFRKENDLPNLHDYVPCQSSGV